MFFILFSPNPKLALRAHIQSFWGKIMILKRGDREGEMNFYEIHTLNR